MVLAILFLVDGVAGQVHSQTVQGAAVHAGKQNGGVHIAALEVGQLVHGCCGHCTFEGSCDHPAPAGETGCKPEGVAVEMIDCILRILDWCAMEGVDVDELLRMKLAYNKGRPYRHGGKAL